VAVYVLCVLTSGFCAALLTREYRRTPARLLLWSALSFTGWALNVALVFLDPVVFPVSICSRNQPHHRIGGQVVGPRCSSTLGRWKSGHQRACTLAVFVARQCARRLDGTVAGTFVETRAGTRVGSSRPLCQMLAHHWRRETKCALALNSSINSGSSIRGADPRRPRSGAGSRRRHVTAGRRSNLDQFEGRGGSRRQRRLPPGR
jgi:Family of unknown function (DUF5985)